MRFDRTVSKVVAPSYQTIFSVSGYPEAGAHRYSMLSNAALESVKFAKNEAAHEGFGLKILLPLLLLVTLGMLAALPHLANADDNGQNEGAHHQTAQETSHKGLTIRFHIRLTGDQQVPAVNTMAFGFAEVQLSEDNTTLSFEVVVCNIVNVIASRARTGRAE